MTDKKLTDEEIIKRLERCVRRGNRNYDTDIVLDLINRQKSEIERLRQAFETAVIERDMIQAQKDFECKKAVGKFAKELEYYFGENGSYSLSYVRKAIGTLLTDWLWR